MGALSTPDVVVFVASLLAVMALGLWAGRKEDTSEDFYLAGRSTRWWGVAGSIFGSNVSANHIVGMMGVVLAVGWTTPLAAGLIAAIWTWSLFVVSAVTARRREDRSCTFGAVLTEDRFWAGLLAATAVWMMYYFRLMRNRTANKW